jgi:diacylglycerol kinase (ATP)
MRSFFIINPRAGARKDLSALPKRLPADAAWAHTERAGHAAELARGAARAGFEAVVACGGDGTVNEVLNGLMGSEAELRPALGLLPVGTANDLARSLGLARGVEAALARLQAGATRRMDVGVAVGAFGERFFGISAFVGAAAVMAERANRTGKPMRGLAGYLPHLSGVLRYRADVTVEADGTAWRGPILSVQAANGATGGGGLPIHPGARLDDGLLDLMVIRAASLPQTLALLALLPMGLHTRLPFVSRRAAREVTLSGEGVALALDGEIVGTLPARIGVRPGALHVVAPPG